MPRFANGGKNTRREVQTLSPSHTAESGGAWTVIPDYLMMTTFLLIPLRLF